jgi:hypothetical protein
VLPDKEWVATVDLHIIIIVVVVHFLKENIEIATSEHRLCWLDLRIVRLLWNQASRSFPHALLTGTRSPFYHPPVHRLN